MYFTSNKNASLPDNLFASLGDLVNLSDANPRVTFDVIKFLNSSLEFTIENETNKEISEVERSTKIIYILGLFELTTNLGRQKDGENELMAAKMAVRHVNALKILPGYKLALLVNDTQCDPGVAIDRFFHAIYSNTTILMLLGSGCSNVTEALAHIVPYWNILQVSYGATSPTLSDRHKFPLFFRTVAPDSTHNIAKRYFIKLYQWNVITAFSQTENEYLLPVNHLITELEKENVSCISTVTFSLDNYREQLNVLKSLDIRIIIGSFSISIAPLIFCAAYDLGMYGNEYVWILESPINMWWQNPIPDCNFLNLQKAIEGVIMIGDYQSTYYDEHLLEQMTEVKKNLTSISRYTKHTYDAIWTMALTLRTNNMDLIEHFNYGRNDLTCAFLDTMRQLEFLGLSGPIKFNGGDRVGDLVVSQIQEGKIVHVAFYNSIKDQLEFQCEFCKSILWKNGQVPIAQKIYKITLVTIPHILYYLIAAISTIGITISLVFLYFNLKFRRMKIVKLSSPNLNNFTVIGCILVYLSVILFGFHNINSITKAYFDEWCTARIYLLSVGFSLTFGSMFAKSYRVHHLFRYTVTSRKKSRLLKDQQLISLILIPLFIDSVIIALWITVDPLKRVLYNLALEVSEEDPRIIYQPQVELCQCHNTIGWHIALFGYKTLILVMGVYMAWKTRHVKVPALNDSEYIGICVYSAVFSTLIVIVFSFVTEYFISRYLAISVTILASTTITLVLMFKSIFGKVNNELGMMQSMGLKMQHNTRRFIGEDPKELLSRLEIQNKVYKCELESLDKEIVRLEALLGNSTTSSNKSSGTVIQIFPEIHYLNVPRGSWPTWQNQSIKAFASENKLNNVKVTEKANFFGKLKKFFGSLASLHQNTFNNLENRVMDEVKPKSNPEISNQLVLPLGKMKSESCIRNLY